MLAHSWTSHHSDIAPLRGKIRWHPQLFAAKQMHGRNYNLDLNTTLQPRNLNSSPLERYHPPKAKEQEGRDNLPTIIFAAALTCWGLPSETKRSWGEQLDSICRSIISDGLKLATWSQIQYPKTIQNQTPAKTPMIYLKDPSCTIPAVSGHYGPQLLNQLATICIIHSCFFWEIS